MKRAWLVMVCALSACECAQLPEALFQCESDGACAQEGFTCGDDGLCHPPAANDAGVDAGEPDASVDAGENDAGVDDAGFDAGVEDAGVEDGGMHVDAGLPDAGLPDAGPADAGCVPTGAIDEPDDQQLDVDCDGFDGDLSRAVFVDPVNGDDAAAGTRDAPRRTLASGLSLGRAQLYLATGTANAGTLQVDDAVSVYGGYDATNWSRSATYSVISGRLWAAPRDGGRVVLEQLDVQPPAVTQDGVASYAVTLVSAASTSRITRCRLNGGTGGDGADGFDAGASPNGNTGAAGAIGDGGPGGAAVSCGDAGMSFAGFGGGAGGTVGSLGAGADGEGGSLAGDGAGEHVCLLPPCVGFDGGAGLTGPAGSMSTTRAADPAADFLGGLDGGWWFGAQLSSWTPATPGRGGGGAGGGGAVSVAGVIVSRGGGAGGGGSGGCGARSGTAGQAGGASISLVLWASSPTLRDVQLVGGAGGRGGNGGAAGTPGTGGIGGPGAPGENVSDAGIGGSGARGGNGGAGGPGRRGPGGWGGPLVGVFCGGGASPNVDATVTWQTGTPGAAGNGDPNGAPGGEPASGFSEGCP
ncbi:MAG: hypothetical protein DI536_08355 [Archangium gephyra]|uniref:Uncharacterized protein n=1 Tax=Archangium gephyra TaxID=48 RepID=A0A2W5VXP1_9BACT|nr:MAG: hypothetical protein DI536_08355 [Archangium gephyra]